MFLKRLELQGFKSFPEKIKLEFNKGITAVVGPNGSGKSNISDAVRWVLGEKSIKNLRGTKMEDVIFSGTQNRKPLGFAEVSMVIDNSDKKLDMEYTEIVVTRRVYRSGESEFSINNNICRLKDIHELFMDTGVGREGYSIIGQGRIDEILSSKSEDRRMLFEEAAGIVKFKNRKIEAESKLEKEKQNLIRVNDIISELESQIKPLEIQSEKTKKYLSLTERLKLVKINIFLNDIKKSEADIKNADDEISNISSQIEEYENIQKRNENEKNILNESLNKIEEKINSIKNQLIEIRSAIEQKENDIKLTAQEIEHIKSNEKRVNETIEKNISLTNKKNDEINLLTVSYNAKNLSLQAKKEILENKIKEFEFITSHVSENEELINKYNSDIIEKMNVLADIKSSFKRTESLNEQFKTRKEQIENEKNYYESQLHDKSVHLEALEKELNIDENKEKKLNDELEISKNNYQNLKENIEKMKKEREINSKNINETYSRFKVLSELEKEHEGYYGGVKAVLKERDNRNSKFSGIIGAVGEIITVDEKFETAIETALGSSIQNIIAETENDVKTAIDYLKISRKGRATFLPLTSIKAKKIGNERDKLLNENGVIGIADEIIKYSPEYKNVISNILGKVLVIDNIDDAVEISKKYNYSYKIVTLDGELLNIGGSITGGSINKKASSIFSRSREISDLSQKLKEIEKIIKNVNLEIEKNSDKIELIERYIESGKDKIQKIYLNKANINNKINITKNNVDDIKEKIKSLNIEFVQINQQIDISDKSINQNNEKINALNLEIENLHTMLNKYQSEIQSDRDIKETKSHELTEQKIEITELEQKINSDLKEISRIKIEISTIETEQKILKSDLSRYNQDKRYKELNIERFKDEILKLNENKKVMQKQDDSLTEEKDDLNKKINSAEQQIKEMFETLSKIRSEFVRLESKKEQLELKKNQLFDDMWEEYGITYIAASNYEKIEADYSQIQKEEKDIKNEIKNLGNINPNAIEEYKNVKERYEFLVKQKNDIINAEENLKTIISELEKLMKEQFAEQFKIICENFKEVFSEMFGGGSASLNLADEKDILNSGIDIAAQPPGKRLQSMSLLSGGERALTAMALLFAILRMKPSPFCILDEIEAALDDANVNRYASFIKKLSYNTQFILITHRKGTMEAADILYGVTMQEQGISKLVSVKFTENEAV